MSNVSVVFTCSVCSSANPMSVFTHVSLSVAKRLRHERRDSAAPTGRRRDQQMPEWSAHIFCLKPHRPKSAEIISNCPLPRPLKEDLTWSIRSVNQYTGFFFFNNLDHVARSCTWLIFSWGHPLHPPLIFFCHLPHPALSSSSSSSPTSSSLPPSTADCSSAHKALRWNLFLTPKQARGGQRRGISLYQAYLISLCGGVWNGAATLLHYRPLDGRRGITSVWLSRSATCAPSVTWTIRKHFVYESGA